MMKSVLIAAVSAVQAYLLGSIDTGILVSKFLYHDDVRKYGSGAAGMTNMLRTFGKKAAALTAVGDVLKGVVAVCLGRWLFGHLPADAAVSPYLGVYLAAILAVVGHSKPIYFGFKGGKGVLVAPTVHGNLLVGPNAEPVEGNDTSCTSSGLEFVKATAQRSVPSINFGESIRSFAGVRANLDVDDFIIGEEPEAPGWIDLAGMKSPGLSAAPAVAEEAVAILQQRGVLGAEKADYKDGRRHIRFKELSAEEKAALVKEQPAYGRVICRCETITEGEILAALHSEVPANTIDGVKRRAGAGMGRCQGGFCGPRVLELISRELGIDPLDILQDKNGSNVLLSETKVGGKNNG